MIQTEKAELMNHLNDLIDESTKFDDSTGRTYSDAHRDVIEALEYEFSDAFISGSRLFKSDEGYEDSDDKIGENVHNPRFEAVKEHRYGENSPCDDFSLDDAVNFLRNEVKIPRPEKSKKEEAITRKETLEKILNPRLRVKREIIENYVRLRFPDNEEKRNELLRVFGYCQKSGTSESFSEKWNEFDCCCSGTTLKDMKNIKYNSRIHTVRRFAIVSSEGNDTYAKAREFLEEFYRHYGFALTGDEDNIDDVFNTDESTVFDIGDRLAIAIIRNDYFNKMSIDNPMNDMYNPFWYYLYIIENIYAVELKCSKKVFWLSGFGYFMVGAAIEDKGSDSESSGIGEKIAERLNAELEGRAE